MKKNGIVRSIIIFVITFFIVSNPVYADVGDFETYSSDSSWSSGGSSWSSSDSGSSGDLGLFEIVTAIIGIAIGVGVFLKDEYYNRKYSFNKKQYYNQYHAEKRRYNQEEIVKRIQQTDEFFSKDQFTSWARDLFVKLQYAWSDRDWSTIRCFETEELYEQHSTQLRRYVQNKQINKIERVSVNSVTFLSFEQIGGKDVLSVVLNTKMIDYIVDETTGQVVKGDKNTDRINNYKLTFVRTTGVKTKLGDNKLNVTNCPNCGAPTEITSAGKCSYCGSVITTGEYNWVLSNLERYNY